MPNYKIELSNWFSEHVTDENLFLVDASVSRNKISKVMLRIDGDEGISIDQCAEISRALSKYLEEKDWFAGAYNLEVTSPGVDFPLIPRQLPRHIGRTLKVDLKNEDKPLKGKLVTAEDTRFEIHIPSKKKNQPPVSRWIEWADVKKAITVISFN
ncbi:MAG: ribosome maturation factor RimP [Bacteroidota bacterium]